MNIFVLSYDITRCAQYHVDKHCVKMILESTQLLNNALIKHDKSFVAPYKETHKNHPCSIWTAQSVENFKWLTSLALALCEEYTFRYHKTHKCEAIINQLKDSSSVLKVPNSNQTEFALCMPDEYKVVGNAVQSYRNYYIADKARMAKWSHRNTPHWWPK